MGWFNKKTASLDRKNSPVLALPVNFDKDICQQVLQRLIDDLSEHGGIEACVVSLQQKHELFHRILEASIVGTIDRKQFDSLFDCVFPARRRLSKVLATIALNDLAEYIRCLLLGNDEVNIRLENFLALEIQADKKARRAAWDLAAELLHYYNPDQYPLMTRWVWDANAMSGALREFIRGNDSLSEIPISGTLAHFQAARGWLMTQLSAQGFYRDEPFVTNLLLARAYAEYVLAMSQGMGMMNSGFGGKMEHFDFMVKLLGIDGFQVSKTIMYRPV